MQNLQDKKIIITGASKGLGSVCAKELSKQGARLVLLARSLDKLEEVRQACKHPESHRSIVVDLTDMQQLRNAIDEARNFFGQVDVILHVAGGGLGLRDPLISAEDFDKLYALNLKSIIEINRLILPHMIERKKGNLVHVGSITSTEAVASVGYNTVKAALAAYVRSLGREVAKSGIVVTGILPGGFYAPGNSWERMEKNNPEVVKRFVAERLPRGYLGKVEELIPLILLLCSDDASMMGGCLVPIDAGEGVSYAR